MSSWTKIRDGIIKPVAAAFLAPYTGGASVAALAAYNAAKNKPPVTAAPTVGPQGQIFTSGAYPAPQPFAIAPTNPIIFGGGGGGGSWPQMQAEPVKAPNNTPLFVIGGGMFFLLVVILIVNR